MKTPGGRLSELDSLRGLAAFAVLIHHTLAFAGPTPGLFHDVAMATPLQMLYTGRPPVLFFFTLSGLVLTLALTRRAERLRARAFAVWVGQRTIRLCGPALAALALSAAVMAVCDHGDWVGEVPFLRDSLWETPLTPWGVMQQALLVAPDGGYTLDNVLWSLAHEWRFSFALPLVLASPRVHGRDGAVWLCLLALTLFGLCGGGAIYSGETLPGMARATAYFVLPFAVGVALATSGILAVGGSWRRQAACLLAAMALLRLGGDLATIVAAPLLIWAAVQPGWLHRVLRTPVLVDLGRVSFSLYLVHEPILAGLHHVLHGVWSREAISATGVALSLAAAWAFFEAIERPCHSAARRVDGMGRARPAAVAASGPAVEAA